MDGSTWEARWAQAVGVLAAVAGLLGIVRLFMPGAQSAEGAARFPVGAPTWSGVALRVPAPAPEPRGGCLWLFRLPALGALSDKSLMDYAGFHNASPLELWRGEVPLPAHQRSEACTDGAAHSTLGMALRTERAVDAEAWSLRWSAATRVEGVRDGGAKAPLWYLFPGMTLELRTPVDWDIAWGPPVVYLAAVATQAEAPATLGWGDARAEVPAANGPVRVRMVGDATGRTLWLQAPATGPALVIHDLAIGERDDATVVLGSWARASGEEPTATVPLQNRPTATRKGAPPRTRVRLGEPDAACRHLVPLPELEAISDLRLYERYRLLTASPVRVWEDERALTPHDRGTGCTGGFAHAPAALAVRPVRDPLIHKYTLGFDPAPEVEVAIAGAEKTPMWWGLPGTALTWTWQAPLVTGPHTVALELVVAGGSAPAQVSVGGRSRQIAARSGEQTVELPVDGAAGAWSMTLDVPADGPVILVRSVAQAP